MKKIIALICLFTTVGIFAQNQHEPQNWQKLKSPWVNVIYQKGQEKEAQKIADIISYIQRNNTKSIGHHYEAVDIILRSNTVESNGFVTLSPFRSEFFNSSPTTFNSLGTTDWITTLAIHEYRHVQQFLNHKSGVTNALYHIFGESGWGAGSVIAVPDWYFEGDAVTMETVLTESGRGRLPKFSALQRALSKNNKLFSYQKMRNQSFKSLVPNHYRTGYQMLNYYRNNYDANSLDNIARNAASFQSVVYPFTIQLKRETGLYTTQLYKKTFEKNQKIWQKQRDSLNVVDYDSYTKNNSKVALYNFPQLLENNHIITLKTSLNDIPTFYEIDELGNENKITANIINGDNYFHYQNNQLLFTGFSYHPRYNYTTYNDIYTYDLNTKKRKRLTHKQRYFSPFFNKNNSKMVAIETIEGNYQLVIMDSNGSKIKVHDVSGVLSRPKFTEDENIVYLKLENNRLAIFKLNTNSEKEIQLTPWTSHAMDDIFIANNMVYYSASFNGIDNIYSSPLNGSKTINQVTNASIGAYQPSVKNNTLYFTETLANGSKISTCNITKQLYSVQEPIAMNWNNQKAVDFEGGNILDKITSKKYHTSQYTSSFEDLEFHDWSPSITEQKLSVSLTASTLLNDFVMNANADIYHNENNSAGISFTGSFRKWFPFLNLTASLTHRDFDGDIEDIDGNIYEGAYVFDELSFSPSITIPYSQLHGNYSNSASLNIGYDYSTLFNTKFKEINSGSEVDLDDSDSSLNFMNLSFSASSVRRIATQNINSRSGFSTQNSFVKGFNNAGINNIYNNNYFHTFNRLFLPGFIKSHNSYLSFGYQKNDIQQVDSFIYARGFENITATEVSNLSFVYQMPLVYPDFGLWGITYFKRIRANLFADFSTHWNQTYYIKDTNSFLIGSIDQNSIGVEIIFDNTFLNIKQALFSTGFRASYLLTNDIQATDHKIVTGVFLSTTLF